MYQKTLELYSCKPMRAKISRNACINKKANVKTLDVNNMTGEEIGYDYKGSRYDSQACLKCPGVSGNPAVVTIRASKPIHPIKRVPVSTCTGGMDYVT
jgi:hypothetical protein